MNAMKKHIFVLLVAVVLAAGDTARPLAADKEQRQMMADIRQLQEQTQQLQNLVGQLSAALDATVKSLNTRLDSKIDAKADEQSAATQKLFANQKVTLDTITTDVSRIREKLEDNSVRVSTLGEEFNALRQLVAQLNVGRAASSADAGDPAGTAPPLDGTPAAVPGGDSPTKLFDAAWSDYTSGLWKLAIEGFESYIRSFPQSERADDAQVNICNAYLNDKKYDEAIRSCDLAIRTYPNGDKIPQAYYRKGLALLDLKRPDDARQAFEYVVRQYPNSAEASLAGQKLGQVTPPAKKP
jgi:TolA-binding protein